jgi:hypothetical protein
MAETRVSERVFQRQVIALIVVDIFNNDTVKIIEVSV